MIDNLGNQNYITAGVQWNFEPRRANRPGPAWTILSKLDGLEPPLHALDEPLPAPAHPESCRRVECPGGLPHLFIRVSQFLEMLVDLVRHHVHLPYHTQSLHWAINQCDSLMLTTNSLQHWTVLAE